MSYITVTSYKNDDYKIKKGLAIFDLDYTDITKGCKLFKKLAKLKQLDCKLNPSTPEQFILRYCNELKIKYEFTQQAVKIAQNVQKLAIAAVHTPLSLATGSIYLMINLNKLNISKKTIADKFDVSQVTISKTFRKLEPFANILVNDIICDKLGSYIKIYQENTIFDERLKIKFIRFDINAPPVNDAIINDVVKSCLYNNETSTINENLIISHSIEIDNKINYLDNKFVKLNIDFVDMIFDKLRL